MSAVLLPPGHFFGTVRRQWLGSDARISEVHHASGLRLPRHFHERLCFSLHLAGAYTERLGRSTISYDPFTVGVYPAEFEHEVTTGGSGGRMVVVELGPTWDTLVSDDQRLGTAHVVVKGGEAVFLATRLYTECLSRGTGPLAIESLLLELLAVASATPARERRMPGWMRLVREMLHGGWRDTVRTAEAAAMAGVHPVYLARVFRRIAGCTLAEYVFRLRVQFACRRLAQPEVHLSNLALEAGFADQSHFTRVFKRVTGITPAAFRQAAFGAEGYAER